MRIIKPLCKAAAFVLIFVLLNQAVCFFLMPWKTLSQEMWSGYRAYGAEEKNIDMVIVGDSHSYEAFDPDVIDPILGTTSYNMGTNSQSLRHSIKCVEDAVKNQDLSEVVLVLDPYNLQAGQERSARAEATFVQGMNWEQPVGARIRNTAEYLFDRNYFFKKDSVNYFFPWLWNRVRTEEFLVNIKSKLTHERVASPDWTYTRKDNGFKGYPQVFNYNEQSQCQAEAWDPYSVSDQSLGELGDLCGLCRENDVELIVVMSPQPRSVIIAAGQSYFDRNEFYRSFFEDQDVPFFDFNLASAEIFETQPEYYKDWEHCNEQGAAAVSASLGELVGRIRAGEDVSHLLYADRKSYMVSFDTIDSIKCKYSMRPGEPIHVSVRAYKGLKTEVEYQLMVKGPGDTEYHVACEYSQENQFDWKPPREGEYQLRVNARRVGSSEPFERYRMHTRYWFAA